MKDGLFSTEAKTMAQVLTPEMLEALLKSDAMIRVAITPEMASRILKRNRINRPIRAAKLKEYTTDMRNGAWVFNGDTITFSVNGELMDGQHRMTACTRSGQAFETIAVFGVPEPAFITKDNGAKRTGADAFSILGVPNSKAVSAIVRWVTLFNQDRVLTRAVFGNSEIVEAYKKLDQDLIQDAVRSYRMIRKVEMKAPPVGPFGGLHYKFSEANPQLAEAFFRSWSSEYLADGTFAPLRKARDAINRFRAENHGRMHEVYWLFCIVTAWNLAATGKQGTSKSFEWDRRSFPLIERGR